MGGNRNASLFTSIFAFSLVLFASIALKSESTFLIGTGILLLNYGFSFMFPAWSRTAATYMNLFATMVIGGLWHGASWNFILWGALNGLGLMTFKFCKDLLPWSKIEAWWARAIGVILTFNFITITRIWFRSGSFSGEDDVYGEHDVLTEWFTANDLVNQILYNFNLNTVLDVISSNSIVLAVMGLGFTLHMVPEKLSTRFIDRFTNLHTMMIWAITCVLAVILWLVGASDPQPFIYFQF